MKPAVDEMFPEGAGPYVDLDETVVDLLIRHKALEILQNLKNNTDCHPAGGSSGLLMDLAANEKAVHSDFFNDFEDLFDDEDLQ